MYFSLSSSRSNLMEAQDIFGLDFDPTEFEQVAREGLDSEGEEEDDEVRGLLRQ